MSSNDLIHRHPMLGKVISGWDIDDLRNVLNSCFPAFVCIFTYSTVDVSDFRCINCFLWLFAKWFLASANICLSSSRRKWSVFLFHWRKVHVSKQFMLSNILPYSFVIQMSWYLAVYQKKLTVALKTHRWSWFSQLYEHCWYWNPLSEEREQKHPGFITPALLCLNKEQAVFW